MRYWLAIIGFCLMINAQAEMVDTFQFHSAQTRQRALTLAKSLRCLQCQNQNLLESNASQAYQLRLEVYELVEQGKTDQQIIEIMQTRFGDFINYDPPFNRQTMALWITPLLLLFSFIGTMIWRINRKKNEPA